MTLNKTLQSATHQLRRQEGLALALPALGAGLTVTLALLAAGHFYPLAMPPVLLAVGLLATLLALAGVQAYAWLRPRPAAVVAYWLDQRLGLDERLSTALELAANPHATPPEIIAAQLQDTHRHLKKFKPEQAFPLRVSWPWVGLSTLLAAGIVAGLLLPNPQVQILQQQAATEAAIAEQAALLEEIRADLVADEALLETPQGQELLQTFDELLQSLKEGNLTEEEAIAALSTAEQELVELQNAAEAQEASLNEVTDSLSQFDSTAELADAIEAGDMAAAAESLTSAATADPQAAVELAEALQEAAEAAQQAGDSELAEALQQAAEAAQQAAAAGQNGQTPDAEAMQEAMEQVAEAIQQAGEDAAGQEAMEEALANIQEAREQLAEQADQEGTGLAQGGQGAGQQPGDGTPQRSGGAGREDPGLGEGGDTADQGAPDAMETDNGPNEGRVEDYESLYAPGHIGGEGGPIVSPDPQGTQGGVPVGEAPVDPNQPDPALVPYDQLYGDYTAEASKAIDDSYIPLGMKDYVRQYFGSLEPGGEQ
jgi:tetratricopeptide (TPR) repeat protein